MQPYLNLADPKKVSGVPDKLDISWCRLIGQLPHLKNNWGQLSF